MKYILILFGLVSITMISYSQVTAKIDNLKELLAGVDSDDERIEILIKLTKVVPPETGLFYAIEAIKLANKHKYEKKEARALEWASMCYRKVGDYPEAIKASLNALRIYERLLLTEKRPILQAQIGSHFISNRNFEDGIAYLSIALESFKEKKDTFNIQSTLINLGDGYRLMNKTNMALNCFAECIELNKTKRNSLIQGFALGNLGMVYTQMKRFEEAETALHDAIGILGELGKLSPVLVYQADLAKIHILRGETKKGEQLLLLSLKKAQENKLKEQIRDFSLELSKLYETHEKYMDALRYRKQYKVYHDSLVNIENVRKNEHVHRKYLLEKKEKNIQFLEVKNKSQLRLVIALSIGALLLTILSGFLHYIQRQRKKANRKLSEQKAIIEKREKEKAVLLRELNHRVKNNLQMVASLFNLQASQLKGKESAAVLKAARLRVDTLTLIHQKLYREEVDGYVKLDDYIQELTENLIFSYGKEVDLQFNLAPLRLHIDSSIPLGIVINELLTNSLKYATSEMRAMVLKIKLEQKEDSVELTICDDGPGFYTENGRPDSFGLKLVKSMVKQLRGSLLQENNNGCCWTICLNVDKFEQINESENPKAEMQLMS